MSSLKQWGAWGWMLGAALLVGCGPEQDKLQLEFILPEELKATNRELTVAVKLLGGPPDRVALYVDDTWLANLDASSYVLDTRAWSEGEHTLTARATMGTEVFTSKGRKVVVDRTPPQVVSVSPAPGQVNVPVDAPISVVFSEPLARSSLESLGLELSGGGEGTETLEPVELSSDGKTLVFAKPSRLVPPRMVSAVLTGAVQDVVGNAFLPARDSGWSWHVPAMLWLGDAMEGLGTARPFAHWVTLRLDARRRPMVAWMASASSVQVRRWEGGQQWASLPSGPELEVGKTSHIELDAEGRPTVTWVQQQGTSSSWATVYRLEEGAWKQLARVGPDPMGSFPVIERAVGRVLSSGLVSLAWQAQPRTFPGISQVMIASQISPSNWGFSSYSTSAMGWRGLVMELDATDAAVTAWCESVEGGMRLSVQRLGEAPMAFLTGLPTRPSYVTNPALVVQRNGNPVVAWSERGAIQVHRWTGTAWEQLGQPFPTPPDRPDFVTPVLALDGSGQLLFAWSIPGKAELWRWMGSGWARLGELSQPTSQAEQPWSLSLQVDEAGVPVLAWSQWSSSRIGLGSVQVFRLNR